MKLTLKLQQDVGRWNVKGKMHPRQKKLGKKRYPVRTLWAWFEEMSFPDLA